MPTTLPVEPTLVESLLSLPIVVWVIGAGAMAAALRVIQLVGRSEAAGPDTSAPLKALHAVLKGYASEHGGRLPDDWNALGVPQSELLAFRPIGAADADEKVLIAHDARPHRQVIEFPHLRPARNVLFWSGRVRLVTESGFERLIEADDAFRAKMGLE